VPGTSLVACVRPSEDSSPGTAVADPKLLDLVNAKGAGLNLEYDADTTATITADPKLGRDAKALATGLARPSAQGDPEEFVIVNVVRLRDPGMSDACFREWRDTYDAGACEPAGGVVGNAETEMSGQTVFIGTCAGGAFTYHVRVGDGGVVLSFTSAGPSRPGERLMRATISR
jgi:hypothetical protein